ncbi:Bug family tripartite tricarboxylate transporter substrate binding protein [Rhodoplanes sp. Z2-YC6860]|uniref:Bug family tripartite tricarboxylate transporter substrate binding protein n=1 Tax=Rhodoplanes sp. Z2-YC6860 TaxID=674703 RepID=UPI00078B886C|nr:tripartite tricarboxylate transporter substrate binding protein [Rhodoplanes sp. Z2-YC6860]AMN40586.1 extra-cytoplasmic solute receptor [Rhodoplanes sp. Z2-YC6860]
MRSAVCTVFALIFALSVAPSGPAHAADYPNQIIKIIVPFPPGGGVDVVARMIAPRLSESLGQSVIIENRGGAGGSVGATAVAQAPHDGYTLLLGTGSTHGTNPLVYTRLGYDPVRDFAPVALITSAPMMLVANNDVPVKNAAELIALAKSKPGELSFGSYGTGSNNHLFAELLNSMAGIQTNHIPYRGSAPMMTDLIGGRIQFAFDGVATTVGYIRSGTVRPLGVSSAKRSLVLPDAPTIAEQGVPGFDASAWFALFAPAGTPQAVIDLLNHKVNDALKAAEVKDGFLKIGNEPVGGGPDVLAATVRSDLQKWATIVREKNIHIDP